MHRESQVEAPVVPIGEPAQGGPRRKVETELLADNVQGNGTNSPLTFSVTTPSVRLVCLLAVTFKPEGDEDLATPNFPVGWFLQLDAWVRASQELGGFPMRANNIVTAQTLPYSINEPIQGIDEIRGTVTAPFPSGLPKGKLYVTATWEPAPGAVPPDLRKMFELCKVLIRTGGQTFMGSE